MSELRAAWLFVLTMAICAACGSAATSEFDPPADVDAGASSDATAAPVPSSVFGDANASTSADAAIFDPGVDASALAITPANATITVVAGQAVPTVAFHATYAGQPVDVKWSTSREELGAIARDTGTYAPTGALGGKASITAFYRGIEVSTPLLVKLVVAQNGDPHGAAPGAPVDGGAGGYGGVGGDGPGRAVDATARAALAGAASPLAGLTWLYPYDRTVWPRGLLAPLLQWAMPNGHAFRAVRIQLTEDAFEYDGVFAAPAAPFTRHPIPQDAWDALALSNGGEDVTVKLTFLEGNAVVGPLTETWTIARGSLKGTVYYNSYGTRLATNYTGAYGDFGAATLSIRPGATEPKLVVGDSTGDGCRACHTVAANGGVLVTNKFVPNDGTSVRVDLASGQKSDLAPGDGRYSWGALSPDGAQLFANAANLQGANTSLTSALYDLGTGDVITTPGLPAGLKAGTPAFSPDGRHVAFNLVEVGATAGATDAGKSLAVMDFDPATKTFSNFREVFTPGKNGKPDGIVWFPSFLPTSTGVVFHLEVQGNGGLNVAETRARCDDYYDSDNCLDEGVRAELWSVDLATGSAARLDRLNGLGYLPPHPSAMFTRGNGGTGGADYATIDTVLNYEPTVGPVPSGGYAWVVFTSRRVYGNVATINPYHSDPRWFDLAHTPNTKKLWVAAIDLNAPPGTDPSHPAFYLPAQELVAANSRGYWVLDPCHADGASCATGDECCGGFCRQADDGGGLVCQKPPPNACAHEFEACVTTSDCCAGEGTTCINGRCAAPQPDAGPPRLY